MILQGLATLLVGNISYSGAVVPVYSIVQEPGDDVDLFVNVASAFISNDEGAKDSFMRPYTVNVDIVSRHTSAAISEKALNAVSSSITQILIPSVGGSGLVSDNDFHVVTTTQPRLTHFNDRLGVKWHLRKNLEFEFIIQQK